MTTAAPFVLGTNFGTSFHNIIRHIWYKGQFRTDTDQLKRHFAAVALPDRIYAVVVVWAFFFEYFYGNMKT